jgi:hypothetical protein
LNLFRRFRKIAKSDSFAVSVLPPVRMEQLGSLWADFRGLEYFKKSHREKSNFINI